MRLLDNLRLELDHSEYRMLTTLCGYLAPAAPIMSIDELGRCVESMNAEPPMHDMAKLAQDLVSELLREAEELLGMRGCH